MIRLAPWLRGVALGLWASCAVSAPVATGASNADDLLIVECALPGQIRQLGRATTYVAPRQPERTTALDCRARGGEYVVRDRATLKSSLAVWLEQARSGDPEAQTIVGELFERGLGTAPDHAAAAVWYRRAAEAGYARAQVNLGHLYEKGLGVPADARAALGWYRQAAGLPGAIALETTADVAPSAAARELARAAAELERREAELERRSAELAALLEAQRTAAEKGMAAEVQSPPPEAPAEPAAAGLLAGPEIVLIEPELGRTRGLVKVEVAAARAVERVVGRVSAPAGVLAVSVNGRAAEVNAAGVFMAELTSGSGERDVRVTAIDRQGKRADLEFALAGPAAAGTATGALPEQPPEDPLADLPGADYALLIGNHDYRHLPRLNTPRADVDRVDALLRDRYGFRTRKLYNATRYQTLSALNELRERLTSDDRLLVYYAGHGELDEANMRGHWLPVDAEPDNTANWLSNVDVTDILNVIRARQILLVVDSCYSGTLTRSSLTRLEVGLTSSERATWLKLMAAKRARVVLTSGALAPVLDFGGGSHSVFARGFIEALESNEEVLLGRSLYQAVAARVAHAAADFDFEQIPQYAPIGRAGHESGDFILRPRG